MITKAQINRLKDISYDILERDRLIYIHGLCHEIRMLSNEEIDSYLFMSKILIPMEFHYGLGRDGELNDKRKDILITFLAIPTNDLYEVLNHV